MWPSRAGRKRTRHSGGGRFHFRRARMLHASEQFSFPRARPVRANPVGEGAIMSVKIGETEMEKKILFAIDEDWLAQRLEDPIDPAMPIIDPHHHLWDRGSRYLLEEIKADIDTSGHNIRATVFLQCDSMYRADGD